MLFILFLRKCFIQENLLKQWLLHSIHRTANNSQLINKQLLHIVDFRIVARLNALKIVKHIDYSLSTL